MRFLRVCLFMLTILWSALALQGIGIVDRVGGRVGAVGAGPIIYVIGILPWSLLVSQLYS